MSKIRLIAPAVLLVFCLMLSGCMKTWSVTFNDQGDIEDWRILHESNMNDFYSITEDGLMLDGYKAIAPYAFFGDCSMTVQFYLECDSSDPQFICILEFSDENDLPNDQLKLSMTNLGVPSTEKFWVIDSSGSSLADGGPIPGLDRGGLNTVKIIKEGNTIIVKVNGNELFSGPFTDYSITYVVPRFIAYKVDESDAVLLFKSIRVNYEGDMLKL